MLNFIIKKLYKEEKRVSNLREVLDALQKREYELFNKKIHQLGTEEQHLLKALNSLQKHDYLSTQKHLAPLLKIKESRVKALLVFGFLHYEQHAYELALKAFSRYMEVEPTHMDVGIFVCELLIKLKQEKSARQCLEQVLASEYLDIELCIKIGRYFLHLRDANLALSAFYKVFLITSPTLKESSLILNAMVSLGALHMADELFNTLSTYRYKNSSELYVYYADAHRLKKKYDKAKKLVKKAIELDKNNAHAYECFSLIYVDLKEEKKAVKHAKKAVEREANNPKYHNALGLRYSEVENYNKAIQSNLKSIELEPTLDAYNGLALDYYKTCQFDLAKKANEEALKIDPYNASTHWNQAFVYLVQGEFEKGFFHYDLRFAAGTDNKNKMPLGGIPLWNKESLINKTIFVYDEQGLGDTIVFMRMLPLLKKMAKRVVFHARGELETLCKSNALFNDIEILNKNDIPKEDERFDYQIPLMSLAYRLNVNSKDVPFKEGYLKASPHMIDKWEKLTNQLTDKKIKVALTWSGNPDYGYDKYRSMKLAQFVPLIEAHPNIAFFAVTKGKADEELREQYPKLSLISVAEHLDSFDDTAGLLHHVDLVITVDTAISHLASAMSKPTWVLLYHFPFWIWGTEGTSYWYQNTKTYRQKTALDWNPILKALDQDLKTFTQEKQGRLS